jgi:hypothetical protein
VDIDIAGFTGLSGTSYATPIAGGFAADIMEAFPHLRYQPQLLKAYLLANSVNIDGAPWRSRRRHSRPRHSHRDSRRDSPRGSRRRPSRPRHRPRRSRASTAQVRPPAPVDVVRAPENDPRTPAGIATRELARVLR